MGLLSVLACLPKHLHVLFVWALPSDVWGQESCNAKAVPAIAELDSEESAQAACSQSGTAGKPSRSDASKALVYKHKKLVEDRITACETQYEIKIPISGLRAGPEAQPQKAVQPQAALSTSSSTSKHPTSAAPCFRLVRLICLVFKRGPDCFSASGKMHLCLCLHSE